jgi:hypothetical protein
MITGEARGYLDGAENAARNLVTALRQLEAEIVDEWDDTSAGNIRVPFTIEAVGDYRGGTAAKIEGLRSGMSRPGGDTSFGCVSEVASLLEKAAAAL